MNRVDKIQKRKERKYERCKKRKLKNSISKIKIQDCMDEGLTRGEAMEYIRFGYFIDDYGREKMICSYQGICSYPCNGDC